VLTFAVLVLKNLGRNKLRTTLTASAVVVLVSIYTVVTTVTSRIAELTDSQAAQTKLIVTERWVTPSRFPVRYVDDIVDHPGVTDWTVWHLYPGYFDESRRQDRRGPGIATRPESLVSMHDGLEDLDPAAVEAFERERTGAVVGRAVLDKMGWSVGDRFTFFSAIPPMSTLEFEIVGELPPGAWSNGFFFREDYYMEATGDDTASMVWLKVGEPDAAQRIASEIQREFDDQQPELKVETESAGISKFASRNQTLVAIIELVVAVLLIDMTIVLSNSISIATRERRAEMAVLKVLGFQPVHIMVMVIGEAMLIGALSGLIGAGLAWLFSELTIAGTLPPMQATSFLLVFPVKTVTVAWGTLIGTAVGLAGSALPAWNARKVKVSDVFAKIA
jgi:putative ABC transport system permease protein